MTRRIEDTMLFPTEVNGFPGNVIITYYFKDLPSWMIHESPIEIKEVWLSVPTRTSGAVPSNLWDLFVTDYVKERIYTKEKHKSIMVKNEQ